MTENKSNQYLHLTLNYGGHDDVLVLDTGTQQRTRLWQSQYSTGGPQLAWGIILTNPS